MNVLEIYALLGKALHKTASADVRLIVRDGMGNSYQVIGIEEENFNVVMNIKHVPSYDQPSANS